MKIKEDVKDKGKEVEREDEEIRGKVKRMEERKEMREEK